MAEKGVIVEFDFAAMDGAGLLFETTKAFLQKLDGIAFDQRVEARIFAGNNYLSALTSYFAEVKTKKTAQKAARDVQAAFCNVLAEAMPKSVSTAFKNFVGALSAKGVKVVIATRAPLEVVTPAFEPILSDGVTLFREESACYGAVKWDSWRRACVMNGMSRPSTIAIAGSGYSVKAALVAGIGAVAVERERVAYQDFSGADAVIGELSAKTAKKVLSVLRVE